MDSLTRINLYHVSTYISLAILYSKKSNYNKALQLLKEILQNTSKDHPYFVFLNIFIGYIYCQCQDYTSAMIYCEKALQLKEVLNPISYVFLCTTFVNIYNHKNDIKNQVYYAQEAYNTNYTPQTSIIQTVYINMSMAYYLLGDLTSALDIL